MWDVFQEPGNRIGEHTGFAVLRRSLKIIIFSQYSFKCGKMLRDELSDTRARKTSLREDLCGRVNLLVKEVRNENGEPTETN